MERDKLIRVLNQNRRLVQRRYLKFSAEGSVYKVSKAKDAFGNPEEKIRWKLNDRVVIFFTVGKRNFRGVISALDLAICGFYPKYGQSYVFHSNTWRRNYGSYTLVNLSAITAVQK